MGQRAQVCPSSLECVLQLDLPSSPSPGLCANIGHPSVTLLGSEGLGVCPSWLEQPGPAGLPLSQGPPLWPSRAGGAGRRSLSFLWAEQLRARLGLSSGDYGFPNSSSSSCIHSSPGPALMMESTRSLSGRPGKGPPGGSLP